MQDIFNKMGHVLSIFKAKQSWYHVKITVLKFIFEVDFLTQLDRAILDKKNGAKIIEFGRKIRKIWAVKVFEIKGRVSQSVIYFKKKKIFFGLQIASDPPILVLKHAQIPNLKSELRYLEK